MVIQIIKFLIVGILSIFYWPLNSIYLYMKKHYLKWEEEDKVSYIVATPLYYLLFIIVTIISVPLERMGEALHPQLEKFR